jgi:glycosyltransferase involved in cell wall biosynthesis
MDVRAKPPGALRLCFNGCANEQMGYGTSVAQPATAMVPAAGAQSVLLATEGTFPFHNGGVSTWCQALTRRLTDVDFHLVAVTRHPYLAAKYTLPPNVRSLTPVPLWGTGDPAEFGQDRSWLDYVRRRRSANSAEIEQNFLPSYERLVGEVVDPVLPPRRLGVVLLRLHLFLRHADYHLANTHPGAWETFDRITRDRFFHTFPGEAPPSVGEVRDAWRLLYRLLLPLALDPPRTSLTHSAAAALCSLPCIMAKLRWGTPFLLTEHGIYLREQYLHLGRSTTSLFTRWFLYRLVSTIVDLNYAFADLVCAACEANTRWERWRNVNPERLRVIYNGVDPDKFSPGVREPNPRPTIVSVGLLSPLKGQLDLIDAAAIVREQIPDVVVRFYGSVLSDGYQTQCEERIKALGLENQVTLEGFTASPVTVLRHADVVALPSLSEAFPYALVEAMMTGAAIVATDVGGVREALGETGRIVPARDPQALAGAILSLLRSPEDRAMLGLRARERAAGSFTEDRFVGAYRSAYSELIMGAGDPLPAVAGDAPQTEVDQNVARA